MTVIFPQLRQVVTDKEFSIGDLGLFVMASYIIGRLIQSAGNIVDGIWWKLRGGQPTDWVRSGRHTLISQAQLHILIAQLPPKLGIDGTMDISR
jgi:hypothetical protein